jgi:hypothetical protein
MYTRCEHLPVTLQRRAFVRTLHYTEISRKCCSLYSPFCFWDADPVSIVLLIEAAEWLWKCVVCAELATTSPTVHGALRRADQWQQQLAEALESRAPPADYIPGCFPDHHTPGPPINKYRYTFGPYREYPSSGDINRLMMNARSKFSCI